MGRLTDKLTQTATKVTVTRNEYGDVVYGATSTINCLYRDISMLQRVGNRDEVTIDGYLWFDSTASVSRGDVFQVEGQYFRVERVVRAKDLLRTNSAQFIKCEVIRQRQVS